MGITEKLNGKEKSYKNLNTYNLISSSLMFNCIPVLKLLDIILT
jgi:hypothetical protein